MAEWVDCHSTPGLLGGYSADMGEYHGPWPIMFPPNGSVDGRFHEVDFTVMLPNPAHPDDVGLAGDGTYATFEYSTYVQTANVDNPVWDDCGWYWSWEGPVEAPIPPVLQPGAHLYVSVFTFGDPPTESAASLVPASYGGSNTQEWTTGHWSTNLEPASDRVGGSGALGTAKPIITAKQNAIGYTNSLEWSELTGLTLSTLPFPAVDLHLLEPGLDAAVAALRGTQTYSTGGMLHGWSVKNAYDPGDGEGVKALDGGFDSGFNQGPAASVQLGQCDQVQTETFSPSELPAFFDTGYGTVWVYAPWLDYGFGFPPNNDLWEPSGPISVSFDDEPAAALITGSVLTYDGPLPANPPDQTINFYARQATYPLYLDPGFAFPATIQETAGMQLLASISVSLDFATGTISAPSTVSLALSSVPLVSDGSGVWALEIVIEPAAWGHVDAINVADPDAGAVPNNSSVTYDSHYGFDCLLADPFAWKKHFPPFRYYVAGERVPSKRVTYLRMTQRNDGIGIGKHPRLPVMNVPTSVQDTHAPRIGDKNIYS